MFLPSRRLGFALLIVLALSSAGLVLPAAQAPQAADGEFARLVREWTTRPEFISPLVDYLPVAAGIPSPKDVIGHHVGEPKKLTYYEDILKYYRALAAASPRVSVMEIGTSDEGRPLVVVAIATADTIAGLERYREHLARLADPRKLSEAQAQQVIEEAKPIYHVMAGLHAGETGPPEMLMELVYRLAADESPLYREIRDNMIVTITPVADPDGRDRYIDWYYAYKVDETSEDESYGGPPYWGKYVRHDNNRDINYSQAITRAVLKWYLEWHPPVLHDIHESVPFLFTFSGQAPQNPTLDPILYAELPWYANFEMAQAIKYGMPGVWTHAFVDMWSPGYFGFMASNHNGMLRMYEVFGNGGANTMLRKIDRGARGGSQTRREWYRPLPPYAEVEWSIRNNVNYGQTALLSALQLTARFPKVVLENFYRKSRNAVEAGTRNPPYAFVIPAGQADMTRVAFVADVLLTQGIELGCTRAEAVIGDLTIPAGSLVVRLDQPYGRLAKILLEKQDFPDPNLRTYDDSAWTMGLLTHTEVKPIADKAILDVATDPVDRFTVKGRVEGKGEGAGWVAVAANGSPNLVSLRFELASMDVHAASKAFPAGPSRLPAGSLLIQVPGAAERRKAVEAIERLGLVAVSLAARPDVPTHPVDLPRVAVFSTWGGTQEVGWVRYALDRFGVPYELVYKERVRQGDLRSAFDLIILPSQSGSAKRLVFDLEPKDRPLAYRKTERFRNLGMYGESDDITGGMGLEGVVELRRFVEKGGLLVTMGAASYFPPEFGLARRVDASRPGAQFYAPGPIVQVELLRPDHPVFYGYDKKVLPVRWAGGPLLRVPDTDKKQVLMQFPGGEASALSGLMRGAAEIKERPAAIDVPLGDGRVLLFATNPCYRWQNLGEFNMLFNAILHWNDFGKQ